MLTSGPDRLNVDRFFLPNFGKLWRESSPDAYIWNPRPKQYVWAALREGKGLPQYKWQRTDAREQSGETQDPSPADWELLVRRS